MRIVVMYPTALAFGMPGTTELIIIAVVALLIFGRRLPDVARSVGKSIVEFKKGIREAKDDINTPAGVGSPPQPQLHQPDAAPVSTAPPSASTSQAAPDADHQTTSADDTNNAG